MQQLMCVKMPKSGVSLREGSVTVGRYGEGMENLVKQAFEGELRRWGDRCLGVAGDTARDLELCVRGASIIFNAVA